MSTGILENLRGICLQLEAVTERVSHGHPAFFFRDKKTLAMYRPGENPEALWCPAKPGDLEFWQQTYGEIFYPPPYFAWRGWVGLRLSDEMDWELVNLVISYAYVYITPKKYHEKLLDKLDQ